MVKFSSFYGGAFLKADDIPAGQDAPVVIEKVTIETLDGDDKLALHFAGKDKSMILNKTNGGALAEAFGDDSDNWIGKSVVLYRDKTMFGGKMVDCLRLRVTTAYAAPAAAPAESPAPAPSDIPF